MGRNSYGLPFLSNEVHESKTQETRAVAGEWTILVSYRVVAFSLTFSPLFDAIVGKLEDRRSGKGHDCFGAAGAVFLERTHMQQTDWRKGDGRICAIGEIFQRDNSR